MAPKSACSIIFAILSVLAVAIPIIAAASSGTRIGGWQPIKDASSAEVVAIAKFAVAAYNNQEPKKRAVTLVSVVKGETQVVKGTNYRLVISGTFAGAAHPNNFDAVVHSDLKHSLNLISFREEYCLPSCN